ncbi:hypothetical protein DL771_011604 [Monosporascus sp. 5C6A]|nr:hypothetical protein DL771_011604 [Monosporascus sp. 5C6A]
MTVTRPPPSSGSLASPHYVQRSASGVATELHPCESEEPQAFLVGDAAQHISEAPASHVMASPWLLGWPRGAGRTASPPNIEAILAITPYDATVDYPAVQGSLEPPEIDLGFSREIRKPDLQILIEPQTPLDGNFTEPSGWWMRGDVALSQLGPQRHGRGIGSFDRLRMPRITLAVAAPIGGGTNSMVVIELMATTSVQYLRRNQAIYAEEKTKVTTRRTYRTSSISPMLIHTDEHMFFDTKLGFYAEKTPASRLVELNPYGERLHSPGCSEFYQKENR